MNTNHKLLLGIVLFWAAIGIGIVGFDHLKPRVSVGAYNFDAKGLPLTGRNTFIGGGSSGTSYVTANPFGGNVDVAQIPDCSQAYSDTHQIRGVCKTPTPDGKMYVIYGWSGAGVGP